MSRRANIIEDIADLVGSSESPTRKNKIPAKMLHEIRDALDLDQSLLTQKDILIELKNTGVIETNQDYYGGDARLGYQELKQLRQHLKKFVTKP